MTRILVLKNTKSKNRSSNKCRLHGVHYDRIYSRYFTVISIQIFSRRFFFVAEKRGEHKKKILFWKEVKKNQFNFDEPQWMEWNGMRYDQQKCTVA